MVQRFLLIPLVAGLLILTPAHVPATERPGSAADAGLPPVHDTRVTDGGATHQGPVVVLPIPRRDRIAVEISPETLAWIESIVAAIDRLVEPEPQDPTREAAAIVDAQLARGDWRELPSADIVDIYNRLDEARALDPAHPRVAELIEHVLELMPPEDPPLLAMHEVMRTVQDLATAGELDTALEAMLEFERRAAGQIDFEVYSQWRELKERLRRAR